MQRPVGLALLWLVATTAAVMLAWGGVQLVADRVTEQPRGGPLANLTGTSPDGVDALATPTSGTTDATVTASTPAAPVTPRDPSPFTSPPTHAATTTSPTPAGTPASATAQPTAPSPAPTATRSSAPSSAAPVTRSYTLVGGTAIVRFAPDLVEVVSASPNPGFTLHPLERDGPVEVRVEFESESHRSRLRVSWEGGPREEIEEDESD